MAWRAKVAIRLAVLDSIINGSCHRVLDAYRRRRTVMAKGARAVGPNVRRHRA